MEQKLFAICALIVSLSVMCQGWPSGAPEEACDNLHPKHDGAVARGGKPPFNIVAEFNQATRGLEVKIKAEGPAFKGFMINAIGANDEVVDGTFAPSLYGLYKTLSCGGTSPTNTATHSSSQAKFEAVLDWDPPANFAGPLRFKATVVQEKAIFYIGVVSNVVNI